MHTVHSAASDDMRIKDGYVVNEIAGTFYAVPVVKNPKLGSGMIKLNETAHFIWKMLERGAECSDITEALAKEYDVSAETAAGDVEKFTNMLLSYDIAE